MGLVLIALLLASIVCHVYSDDSNNESLNETVATAPIQWKDFWVFRLLLNLIGYGTIIVPGYIIIRYLRGGDFIKQTGMYEDDSVILKLHRHDLRVPVGSLSRFKLSLPQCNVPGVLNCMSGRLSGFPSLY